MVLDEADQMLERGFAESVEEVLDEVFHDSKNFICHALHKLGAYYCLGIIVT